MDLRVAAYAVITDDEGRMLLPHWGEGELHGWTLPGGGLEPGEHPDQAVVREVFEETGYHVELDGLLGIDSIVVPSAVRVDPTQPDLQALRVIYRAHVVAGSLTVEADGTTDDVGWFAPHEVDALDRVPAVDVARRFAGLLVD
ncbi:NUDIX hydrolase [Cellulomonas composti]|uniref:Nudix hydrolase domain-containing protein n=1 Tax=Cellulomonas composti TaxID=266130 RepID=A0A511J9S3_9CELL|nr:NUDIX domain-containing protein [Cellulomonas composti]GEL94728.1 hypothetical protein CCO02nite_13860 [Cellulomonas composti]